MLHRTRNLGVVGTRGAGVIAHTKGPYYSASSPVEEDIFAVLTEAGQPMKNEVGNYIIIPETA